MEPIPEELAGRRWRLHLIANSHLDREWTNDFQYTRLLTVRFLDRLFEVLEAVPDYQFVLDSQTIPIEDYLEVRPEKEPLFRRFVGARRLWIGPWYTAPDMTMIAGESIVRNLLVGTRLASRHGGAMRVGYTPFGFGQVSQLPQIYAGFGIDTALFYRGVTACEAPLVAFRWRGPDGTVAFCSRASRYNFYFGVMRPFRKGGGLLDRVFDPRNDALPVHLCDAARHREHYLVGRPRDLLDRAGLRGFLTDLLREEARQFPGRVVSLMNGMDTSSPDPLDDEVLRALRAVLPPEWEIFHSNLEAFMEELRDEVEREGIELPLLEGEMRHPGPPTPETTMLGDVVTSRVRQKIRITASEARLARLAEPLAALAWTLGAAYPRRLLEIAWKTLLACHPHDTIAGCGVDAVEADMLARLDQVDSLAEALLLWAARDLAAAIDTSGLGDREIPILVFNPARSGRSAVLRSFLDLPEAYGIEHFEIHDPSADRVVPHAVLARRRGDEKVVRDPTDATTFLPCDEVEVRWRAEDLPGLGYKVFVLRAAGAHGPAGTLARGATAMENEHLRVAVRPDGALRLEHKETGAVYDGLAYFRDRGEAGNAWMSHPPARDRVVSSLGEPARIAREEEGPLAVTYRIDRVLRVPARREGPPDREACGRAGHLVEIPIAMRATLCAGSRILRLRVDLENRARDHLLQIVFPLPFAPRVSAAESAFDVVERPFARPPAYALAQNPTHPMLRFVDLSDGRRGLALLSRGLKGYETIEEERAVAVTLLRAYEIAMCTVTGRWERRPELEGSQVLGPHAFELALYPHRGDWREGVLDEAEAFELDPLVIETGRARGDLPLAARLLAVEPAPLAVSAIKKAEDAEALVVRLWNPDDRPVRGRLTAHRPIRAARLLDLEERPIEGGRLAPRGRDVAFEVGPRRIVTVALEFA